MKFDVNKFEKSVDKYAKEITYTHPGSFYLFFCKFLHKWEVVKKPKPCIFVYEMTKFWANIKF